jgi:hypothetical protein
MHAVRTMTTLHSWSHHADKRSPAQAATPIMRPMQPIGISARILTQLLSSTPGAMFGVVSAAQSWDPRSGNH